MPLTYINIKSGARTVRPGVQSAGPDLSRLGKRVNPFIAPNRLRRIGFEELSTGCAGIGCWQIHNAHAPKADDFEVS